VAYSAYGRTEGARVNSTAGFVKTVGFDIPVMDDDDAPMVLAWDDTRPDNALEQEFPQYGGMPAKKKYHAPYHGPDHVRMLDGGYIRPLRAYEFLANAPGDTSPLDLRQFIRATNRGETSALSLWQNPKTRKNRTPEQHFATVDDNALRFAVRDLGKALANYRIVGDQVYVRCGQPTVTFEDRRYGRPARPTDTTGLVFQDNRALRVWYGQTIRIMTSERDEAFATRNLVFTAQMFKDVLKKTHRLNLQRDPEIRDPVNEFNASRAPTFIHPDLADSADIDECALNLRRFIAIIEKNPERLLPPGDHRPLKLFYDITEALRLIPHDDGFDLLEAAGREWLDRYGTYNQHFLNDQPALRRALEIAEDREVTLDASFRTPSGPTFR
jgi:hypothetical protein